MAGVRWAGQPSVVGPRRLGVSVARCSLGGCLGGGSSARAASGASACLGVLTWASTASLPERRAARPRVLLDLLPQRVDGASGLRQRCGEQVGGVEQRRLEGAGQLGQQNLAGLEVGELA